MPKYNDTIEADDDEERYDRINGIIDVVFLTIVFLVTVFIVLI